MNDDWPAWIAGLGVALGTAWAVATKGRKTPRPEPEDDMKTWQRTVDQTLSAHQERLDRVEVDRREDREDFGQVFKKLEALNRSLARIEGALNIPRNGQ